MIIALLNQKGGVGKTTLATHLAGVFARRGQSVMVIDADPQGSALDWARRRAQLGLERTFGVIGLARETLHIEAPQIARHVDHIIIDGPPRVTALARSALLAADVALIPVQPSAYDLWASQEMIDLVGEAMVFRPQLKAAFVVNRRVVRTIVGREARGALSDHRFPTLDTEVHQRTVFVGSVADGRLATEDQPRSLAAGEINRLASEIAAFAV